MATPIVPRFIDAIRWTQETAVLLRPYGSVPDLRDPKGWKAWAATVIQIPTIAALSPPRPETYRTWETWANSFNLIVGLLPT